jgi:hypothetical protein
MPFAQEFMLWILAALAICIVLNLALRRMTRPGHQRYLERGNERLDNAGYIRKRENLEGIYGPAAVDLDEPWRRAKENMRLHPAKEATYHPHPMPSADPTLLVHPLPSARPPTIKLTARDLARINTQRKLHGRPPLNKRGFQASIAKAWDQPVRQPQTHGEWLTYFVLFECLIASNHRAAEEAATALKAVRSRATLNHVTQKALTDGDTKRNNSSCAGLACSFGPRFHQTIRPRRRSTSSRCKRTSGHGSPTTLKRFLKRPVMFH